MNINFRELTVDNWIDCVKLSVKEEQKKHIATNVVSVAESKFYPKWTPKAIYLEDTAIGFFMYGPDDDTGQIWLIRFMIDQHYQGKGYGKASLKMILDEIAETWGCREIFLSFAPGNEEVRRLYESFGFADTGRVEYGEIVYRLDLKK